MPARAVDSRQSCLRAALPPEAGRAATGAPGRATSGAGAATRRRRARQPLFRSQQPSRPVGPDCVPAGMPWSKSRRHTRAANMEAEIVGCNLSGIKQNDWLVSESNHQESPNHNKPFILIHEHRRSLLPSVRGRSASASSFQGGVTSQQSSARGPSRSSRIPSAAKTTPSIPAPQTTLAIAAERRIDQDPDPHWLRKAGRNRIIVDHLGKEGLVITPMRLDTDCRSQRAEAGVYLMKPALLDPAGLALLHTCRSTRSGPHTPA